MANQIDIILNVVNKSKTALTEFNSSIELIGKGLAVMRDVLAQTVDAAVAYSNEIESMATITGTGTAETIKLVEAADDFRVTADVLRVAVRKMADDGVRPTTENLAKMADEFLALKDPLLQTQYAIEKFGLRAGPEMAKLLARGGDALREAAAGSEDFAQSMADAKGGLDEYQEQLDSVNDTIEQSKMMFGAKLTPAVLGNAKAFAGLLLVSNALLDVLSGEADRARAAADAADAAADAHKRWQHEMFVLQNSIEGESGAVVDSTGNTLDWIRAAEKQKKAAENLSTAVDTVSSRWRLATSDAQITAQVMGEVNRRLEEEATALDLVGRTVQGDFSDGFKNYRETMEGLRGEHDALQAQLERLIKLGYRPTWKAYKDLTAEIDANTAAQQDATSAWRETTAMMTYQAAVAAGLSSGALLDLAKRLGLLNQEEYNYQKTLQILAETYGGAAEKADDYTEAMLLLNGAMADGKLTAEEMERILDRMNGKEYRAKFTAEIGWTGKMPPGFGVPTPDGGVTDPDAPVIIPGEPEGPPMDGRQSVSPGGATRSAGTVNLYFYGEQAAKVAKAEISALRGRRINAGMGG